MLKLFVVEPINHFCIFLDVFLEFNCTTLSVKRRVRVYGDFVNEMICQSLGHAHKGSTRSCIYRCECMYKYVCLCICTVFLNGKSFDNLGKIWRRAKVTELAAAMPFGKQANHIVRRQMMICMVPFQKFSQAPLGFCQCE